MWATVRRGNDLAEGGIEGTQESGYLSATDRYAALSYAATSLALSGGVLMASAIAVGVHIQPRGSLAWGISALTAGAALLGVGAYFAIREPDVLIETTELYGPSRHAGSLLIGAALPLIAYGVVVLPRRRPLHLALRGISQVRVTW